MGLASSGAVSLLLDLAYGGALLAASPWCAWKLLSSDKYREGLPERLGGVPRRPGNRPCVWVHGVSLGEVLSIRRFLEALDVALPGWDVALSTTTKTGYAAAKKHHPQRLVFHFPFDLGWAIERTFERIRPSAVVFVELDLWPNFLIRARRRHLPVLLVNGRMSPRSHKGYLRFRPWVRELFGTLDLFALQEERYRQRYLALGLPDERIVVTGSMKYDTLPEGADGAAVERLFAETGLSAAGRLLVGGSTHAPEERHLLEAYVRLLAAHPDLRLAICPRHPERGAEVAAEAARLGLAAALRSRKDPPAPAAVWVFDTIGELVPLYQMGDLVFVGGSLMNRGGQNMMEPAALGKAVLFGPYAWNFGDSVDRLTEAFACRVVPDAPGLEAALAELLARPEAAREMGERARRVVSAHRGASERSARLVAERLSRIPSVPGRSCI